MPRQITSCTCNFNCLDSLLTEQHVDNNNYREKGMRVLIRLMMLALVISSLHITTLIADTLTIRKDAPSEYVVKKGDTLWDISSLFLNDPWLWPKLWKLNPQVKNPHLIYPGDQLKLVYEADGTPKLVMGKRSFSLSPQKRIAYKKDEPIPMVPLNALESFLSYELALDEDTINSLPYVLGTDRTVKRALPGDLLYIKGDLKSESKFAIYRKGKTYTDPDSEDVLGYEAVLVAVADLINSGDPAEGVPGKIRITTAKQEVRASDVVMPIREGQALPAFFKMVEVNTEMNASIIATPSDLAGVSKYDVVIINKGKGDNIAAGNILTISRQSPTVVDQGLGPKYQEDATRYEKFVGVVKNLFRSDEHKGIYEMPFEDVGQLMIFKVYDKVSYGIITKNKSPVYVGDKINTPN